MEKGIRKILATLPTTSDLLFKVEESEIRILDLINRKENMTEDHNEFWDQAGSLDIIADQMLIKIQEANINGMCFASEAHVSEGAFSFGCSGYTRKTMGCKNFKSIFSGVP